MDPETQDAEVLRRRLYRPGASTADVAGYLRATEEERARTAVEPSPVAPPAGSPLHPFVLGGVVVAGAALLGAVLLTSGPRTVAPTTTPTVAAAATPEQTEDADGSWRITFVQTGILDGGRTAHANGAARTDGPERYRYVVARGDTVSAMAGRFGLCSADVLDSLPYGVDPGALPEGASLVLSHSDKNAC